MARMVELAPAVFLEGPWPPKAAQLGAAAALLRRELEGADCDFMFQVRGAQHSAAQPSTACTACTAHRGAALHSTMHTQRGAALHGPGKCLPAHLHAVLCLLPACLRRRTPQSCLSRWSR